MAGSFLKTYKLVVQTLSPIHIGSGRKLTQTDFVMQKDRSICVIDDTKLFDWISTQPNSERLALELADSIKSQKFNEFFRDHLSKQLPEITAYTISFPYLQKPREITSFIRTAASQPYMPASSIKGVLRSALLRGKMLGDSQLRHQAAQAIAQGASMDKPKTQSDFIQAMVMVSMDNAQKQSKWSNYDINRLLAIRDAPVPPRLNVFKVQILSVTRGGTLSYKQKTDSENQMELYIEAIPTGQRWGHEIVWLTHLLSREASQLGFDKMEEMMAFLPEYCRHASVNLLEQEYEFYKRHQHADLAQWFEGTLNRLNEANQEVFILPLGWGSGYDAKTITDLLGEKVFKRVVDTYANTAGLGKPGRNRHAEWLGPADSPKSRKVVVHSDDKLEP